MELIIVVGISAILLLATFLYRRKKENERSVALDRAALKLGFKFNETPSHDLKGSFEHFDLFTRGRSGRIKNVMQGRSRSLDICLFGYSYTVDSGKSSRTYYQSVISFSNEELFFPNFDLRPENFMHKIGKLFGYQDINFDNHANFSSSFLLRGEDEKAIRSLFNTNLLNYLQSKTNISIESRGGKMIIYVHGLRVKPEEMKDFYRGSQKTYEQFCRAFDRIS